MARVPRSSSSARQVVPIHHIPMTKFFQFAAARCVLGKPRTTMLLARCSRVSARAITLGVRPALNATRCTTRQRWTVRYLSSSSPPGTAGDAPSSPGVAPTSATSATSPLSGGPSSSHDDWTAVQEAMQVSCVPVMVIMPRGCCCSYLVLKLPPVTTEGHTPTASQFQTLALFGRQCIPRPVLVRQTPSVSPPSMKEYRGTGTMGIQAGHMTPESREAAYIRQCVRRLCSENLGRSTRPPPLRKPDEDSLHACTRDIIDANDSLSCGCAGTSWRRWR